MPEIIGGNESEDTDPEMPELEPVKIENVDIFDKPKVTPATEKKQRKKRVMTEAQKEKLAQARVKALETRRRNSALKKEKKELEKVKKQQELEELRASVKKPKEKKVEFQPKMDQETIDKYNKEAEQITDEEIIIVDKKEDLSCDILGKEQPLKSYSLTQKQIEELQQNAIMNYDNVRKGRKKVKEEEKKKNAEKERQRQELMRLANRSTPQEPKQNYWDNCY